MKGSQPPIPEFEDPPVVEVAISLQFRTLERMQSAHAGMFWTQMRRLGFCHIEDHGELEPTIEEFVTPPNSRMGVRVQSYDDAPPLPRVWFLNDARNELVQLQRDRLIVNWRQGARAEAYPRYRNIIEQFKHALEELKEFTTKEKLGEIAPTQCEITYVNHLIANAGWSDHGDVEQVVTMWGAEYSDTYLPKPEDVALAVRFRMTDDSGRLAGRLHVHLKPAYRSADGKPIVILTLTARGEPSPRDFVGAFRLFEQEHEWIVRGFTSITTKNMHMIWRRKQ